MKLFSNLTRFSDAGRLVLRIAIGVIFIVHGHAKWGMWGSEMAGHMPIVMLTLFRILSVAEPLSGLAMIVGFWTPVAAIGQCLVMLGAINIKINVAHLSFMARESTGWEFDVLILCSLICLLTSGSGNYSIDGMRAKKSSPGQSSIAE